MVITILYFFKFIWNIITYKKYDEDDINLKLYKICATNTLYSAIGSAPIAYLGWFWRDIKLNTWTCRELGLSIETDHQSSGSFYKPNGDPYVCFMVTNKWDYIEFECTCRDWLRIRKLLVKVANNPTKENLKELDSALQSTLPKNWRTLKSLPERY